MIGWLPRTQLATCFHSKAAFTTQNNALILIVEVVVVVVVVVVVISNSGCHLYLYSGCARLNHEPTKTELTWNQKLHNCFIQKVSIFKCKESFQRRVPFRADHTPRKGKGKTTPIKNRPHSIHLQKQNSVATCTYTLDAPDSPMDQPKQNCLGIKSFTVASSKKYRFEL